MLADTLRQMKDDGVERALAFMTSAFSSYSGCRQYREDVARAQAEVGEGAPEIHKLRVFYNHPGYIDPMRERVRAALDKIPAARHSATRIVYTAHSIPNAMAAGCDYEKQLLESCRSAVGGATPGVRLAELTARFGDVGNLQSICNDNLDPLLRSIGDTIASTVRGCLE